MSETRFIGIDPGTGMISSAEKGTEANLVQFRKIRDAFFKVDPDSFGGGSLPPQFGEKMLKKTNAHFIKIGDEKTIYILGDSAYKLASTVRKPTLRPMRKGVLNPKEKVSGKMVEELIKAVAGNPKSEDDVLVYNIPANPIDAEYDVEYHRETLKQIFTRMGYKKIISIDEGMAVVFSELSEDDFTGVGVSFGAGMCNVTYAFMGMPILSFSISKGGDWIDENAGMQVDEPSIKMTRIKEEGVDLKDPQDEYQRSIAVYYEALLKYLVAQIKKLYSATDKNDLPDLYEPIPIVVSGGTSRAGNFIKVFEETIKEAGDFPFKIKEIRHAEEPLFSVANGCYQAAKLQELD